MEKTSGFSKFLCKKSSVFCENPGGGGKIFYKRENLQNIAQIEINLCGFGIYFA